MPSLLMMAVVLNMGKKIMVTEDSNACIKCEETKTMVLKCNVILSIILLSRQSSPTM